MNTIIISATMFRFRFGAPKSWSENDRPPQPDSIPSFQPRGRCIHDSDDQMGLTCASDYPCPDFDPLKIV